MCVVRVAQHVKRRLLLCPKKRVERLLLTVQITSLALKRYVSSINLNVYFSLYPANIRQES